MKPFLNKIIDTVTNAAQNARGGKKLAMGATQHAEEQSTDKQSFHSVLKSAQNNVQKTQSTEKQDKKSIAKAQAKTQKDQTPADTKDASTETNETSETVTPEIGKQARETKKGKASTTPAAENTAEAAQSNETAPVDATVTEVPAETSLESAANVLSADKDKSANQDIALLDPSALAIALQIQPAQISEALPLVPTIDKISQEASIQEVNTPNTIVTTAMPQQAAPAKTTSDNATAQPPTQSFEKTLDQAQAISSDNAAKIKLDDTTWQMASGAPETLPDVPVKNITAPPVDESANKKQEALQTEKTSDPQATIASALASGAIELQIVNTPQEETDTAKPAELAENLATEMTANTPLSKSEAPISSVSQNNPTEKAKAQTSLNTGNQAPEAQAETQAKQVTLAPVPLIALQVKDSVESDIPSAEILATPVASETPETPLTRSLPESSQNTNVQNTNTQNQTSDNPSDQKQEDPSTSDNMSMASKPASKSGKSTFKAVSENAGKPVSHASNEKQIPKESALPVGNTPNDAGVNTTSDANMQNISNSAVPVRETQTSNLKELLTIHANGGEAAEQITNGIQEGLRVNRPEIVIKMSPENLGDVNVKLSTNAQQQLTARLMVSNPETQEVLHEQLHQLKQNLESQGIHVEHLTVSVTAKTDNSAGQSNQSNSQNQSAPQDENRQQFSDQQSFQQQQQQAQQLYQQFNQNNNGSSKFATAPWKQGSANATGNGPIDVTQPKKPEQHNPNGSISVFA